MALYENLLSSLGIDGEVLPYAFRFSVYGGCGGFFEGVKISSFSADEIIFAVSRGKIKVTGKNLCVKKYVEREVVLGGEILCVERA
ncbi:MAG: YabP/YqfC family sporulation protein [Clostridia bacterium]|nr:YabP/YqfC family sporulation protein [Clostridia bacterium]